MNLFTKARAGLNLTPAERAQLKFVEALAVAGVVAALPVLADALSTHGAIVWADVLHTGLATGAVAVILALVKYLKAQGDSPLADAAANTLQQIAGTMAADNHLDARYTHIEAPVPPVPPAVPAASANPPTA